MTKPKRQRVKVLRIPDAEFVGNALESISKEWKDLVKEAKKAKVREFEVAGVRGLRDGIRYARTVLAACLKQLPSNDSIDNRLNNLGDSPRGLSC